MSGQDESSRVIEGGNETKQRPARRAARTVSTTATSPTSPAASSSAGGGVYATNPDGSPFSLRSLLDSDGPGHPLSNSRHPQHTFPGGASCRHARSSKWSSAGFHPSPMTKLRRRGGAGDGLVGW